MNMIRKVVILVFMVAVTTIGSLIKPTNNPTVNSVGLSSVKQEENTITNISDLKNLLENNIESYFNTELVNKLPTELDGSDEIISVIISMEVDPIYDTYQQSNSNKEFSEYVSSKAAKSRSNYINQLIDEKLSIINKSGISYTLGERYDTLLSGFEVEIPVHS